MRTERFFRKSDWVACLATFVISLIVYTLTLQPTVGLEDSGELIVASDFLGVPHPPGYPIWSLLTWFFQWIFHGIQFHGQPNPAWAVNWFSAVSGAAASGVLAMLISRSGMDLLHSLKKETDVLGESTENVFCSVAGIAGGLLLAFSQGTWSQAVIAEVYMLNSLFQALVLLFFYRWMADPKQVKWLYIFAFVLGLGITNHITLMFLGLGFAIGMAFRDIRLFRDFAITGVPILIIILFNRWAMGSTEHEHMSWYLGPAHAGFWVWTASAIIIPVIAAFVLPNGKTVCFTILLAEIGLAFYLYMPISSDQNPPINWGYPRTWQGFMHAVSRGQYEKLHFADAFSAQFLRQLYAYWNDLRSQFYWPVALLAAVPFFFIHKVDRKNLAWLLCTFFAFLCVSVVFMFLGNYKLDIQTLFIARVQFILSHALYAIWIGYGILLLMAFFETLAKNNQITKYAGIAMVLLLPFVLIHKNYNDKEQLRIVGGAEQNGHDFGWQFGNWQLRGVEGIKDDMKYWYGEDTEEFQRQWEAYPCKDYPKPMGTNAIYFGGTDPGRFVPTYMIYSAKVRPDVYLITQNALADNTYMNVMRDLYGDQIWIPSPIDSNRAFQMYVQGVQSGKIQAGADVTTEGGKVQVQGVAGVMQINGFLSRMIFDHNQYVTETKNEEDTRPSGAASVYNDPPLDANGMPPTRTFYVEESYVLPWMYPYLTPHGLIMKINNKPTPLTPEIIKNDTDFWNWYVDRLMNDKKFINDIVARKSFSKLRSAIAGLYAARGKPKEAEAAFRQAVELYDLSPEANFRLADLISREGRYDEAIKLFDDFLEKDPNNVKAAEFQKRLENGKKMTARLKELGAKLQQGTIASNEIMELLQIQFNMGQSRNAERLAQGLLNSGKATPDMMMAIAQLMAEKRKFSTVELALKKFTAAKPKDPNGWINLAGLQLALNKRGEMYVSIQKAIEAGGEPVRNRLRKDKRFDAVRNTKEFQKLVPPKPMGGMGLAPLPGL